MTEWKKERDEADNDDIAEEGDCKGVRMRERYLFVDIVERLRTMKGKEIDTI